MKIGVNVLIDFNYGYVLDATLLECFIEPDGVILFPYYTVNGPDKFVVERTKIKSTDWLFDWVPERKETIMINW